MFIQTESTPNPDTMKFIPGVEVMTDGSADFPNAEKAKQSPLAEALFTISQVRGVFYGRDYVTVTKTEGTSWDILKPMILTTIMEHFVSKQPLMRGDSVGTASSTASAEDSELIAQIKELIDTRVRPAVAEDGGDIIFRGFDDGVVKLELHGSCSGCPSSTMTLKNGIENMLKHYVPEVESVEAV